MMQLLPSHAAFENEQPLRGENTTLGPGEGRDCHVELLLYLFLPLLTSLPVILNTVVLAEKF